MSTSTAVVEVPNVEAASAAGRALGEEIRGHKGKYGAFLVEHPKALALYYGPYRKLRSKAEKDAFREAFLNQIES